jgi:hypothetical protein
VPGSRLAAIALLALGAGVAAGYLLGRRPDGPPPRAQIAPTQSGLAGEVQAALTLQDRIQGVHALSGILARSGPESLSEIRAGFESVFLDVAEIEIVLLAEWWAAFDPEAAFRWTQSTRVANQTLVIRSVVRAWARRDPLAAREALGRILDPVTRRACLDALVSGWEDSGQPGLLEYLHELPPSIEQLRALAAVARRKVLRDGVDGAFRWAEALPEDRDDEPGRFKLQLFRRVASAAASVDLERAAAWAMQHADGPNGDGLLGRVGNTWAMRDGTGAMAWLASLPESAPRERGIEDTYRAWLDWDTPAALAWMRERAAAPEPWLDPALTLFSVAVAREDYAEALAAAERIRDPQRRDGAVITIGRMWRGSDPAAADAWLERSGLDPELRRQILSDGRPGPGGAAAEPTGAGVAPAADEPAPDAP